MCKVGGMCNRLHVVVALSSAFGCGDNSKECGPGTVDERGRCVPAASCGLGTMRDEETGECVPDGSVVCSDGTVFDSLTGTCKIDPTACQGGTVLIHDACVDPTAGLTIDVLEGPEPNGLGIVEDSLAQAGNITLKAPGETFVVHGVLDPWRDADSDGMLDPDVDTYVVTTSGPVLVRVTADGVNGIAAGFVAVAAVDGNDILASWRRFGIHLVGDASKRELWLPKAGTYRIAIGDTRTLHQYLAGGTVTAAPGGDDGGYYVSITDVGPPQPVTLPAGTVTGASDGETLRFYAPAAGTGITMAQLTVPSQNVQGALVGMVNDTVRAIADETSQPARVMFGGLASGDVSFVVVDHVFDIAPSPAAFTLSVNTAPL
jgi:hypothetical protein